MKAYSALTGLKSWCVLTCPNQKLVESSSGVPYFFWFLDGSIDPGCLNSTTQSSFQLPRWHSFYIQRCSPLVYRQHSNQGKRQKNLPVFPGWSCMLTKVDSSHLVNDSAIKTCFLMLSNTPFEIVLCKGTIKEIPFFIKTWWLPFTLFNSQLFAFNWAMISFGDIPFSHLYPFCFKQISFPLIRQNHKRWHVFLIDYSKFTYSPIRHSNIFCHPFGILETDIWILAPNHWSW